MSAIKKTLPLLWPIVILGAWLLVGHLTAQNNPINSGIGLPTNGPCVAAPNSAGICSDAGVPAVYDVTGTLYHLPVPGPTGPQGATGPMGPQGPAGVVVGSVLSGTMNCQGVANESVPKGFSTTCTFTVTGIQ